MIPLLSRHRRMPGPSADERTSAPIFFSPDVTASRSKGRTLMQKGSIRGDCPAGRPQSDACIVLEIQSEPQLSAISQSTLRQMHFARLCDFFQNYSFRTFSITSRGPRSGSDSTRHSLLKSMVSRDAAEYAGHFGSLGVFGFPVRANATHAELVLSASV